MSKLALLVGILLVAHFANSAWAVDKIAPPEGPPNPPYPGDSQITFQWNYSCPNGKGCSFLCPSAGGASNVTALDIYLASIPTGSEQRTPALFYNFATVYVPRSNGFSIGSGVGALSCQVNGMRLDYSGPPK